MFSVCIDVGGTFTDCVVAEHGRDIAIFKALTTPDAYAHGFLDSLALAAEHYGRSLADFLSEVDLIVHGSTVSTNALVEGKTARVGLVCNDGHPDVLTLREAVRKRTFEWRLDFPEPFVSRHLTFPVQGRITADGAVYRPLNEADVNRAVMHFRALGVEAIAVCLLWSIVNPEHELRVREIISDRWPTVPVTLSHELNPIPREYRRMISAAIDASLHPIVGAYVRDLATTVREAGFKGELLLANCLGGMMPAADMTRRPIYSVMSGPTLAPIGAARLTSEPDVLVIDMGGTTFDVSAIREGRLVVSPEAKIGHDLLGIPKVDVRSIGAGGGSIAWVDTGGLLHVGPRSAGARPGPACYGLGGESPTVTDANVVLGIIDPDYFLGGRMRLDRSAAERAVETIARNLGTSLVEAAYTIHTASNHQMIAAIEDITVNEGINPRDSYLVAGGGATPCHVGEIARELGIARLMVPRFTAGLSAYGGLISEIKWEEISTLSTDVRSFTLDRVNDVVHALRAKGDAFLAKAGVAPSRRRFEHVFMGRYEYQSWEIETPFEFGDAGLRMDDLATLVESFHRMHERIYSIRNDEDLVEFTTWIVRAIGARGEDSCIRMAELAPKTGSVVPKCVRAVYVRAASGMVDVPVFDGVALGAGAEIVGPAIVEEETTTLLLLPNMTASLDRYGNYLIEFT